MNLTSTRVIVQLLAETKQSPTAYLYSLATNSRCTQATTRAILEDLGVAAADGKVEISKQTRLELALHIAKTGMIGEIAKVLDWQEFETFVQQCLIESGYDAYKDVRVKGAGRLWQIDVVGRRGDIVLCFDCKHWNSPAYPSKVSAPAHHQYEAAQAFLSTLTNTERARIAAVPLVVMLLDPREKVQDRCVFVSINQLPSFLGELPAHIDELPLVQWAGRSENPI